MAGLSLMSRWAGFIKLIHSLPMRLNIRMIFIQRPSTLLGESQQALQTGTTQYNSQNHKKGYPKSPIVFRLLFNLSNHSRQLLHQHLQMPTFLWLVRFCFFLQCGRFFNHRRRWWNTCGWIEFQVNSGGEVIFCPLSVYGGHFETMIGW